MIGLWIVIAILAFLLILVTILSLARRRPEKVDTSYQEALKALLDGREVEAARKLRDALMKDTDNVDAYIRLGRLVREHGNAERAANVHESLTVRPALKRSEELLIYKELVADYHALGRTEKVIGLLKELIKLASDKLPYLRRLLAMLSSLNRPAEAADILKSSEKLFPDRKEVGVWYAQLAGLAWEQDKGQLAAVCLKRAQKLVRNHPYVMLAQITRYFNSGEKPKVRSAAEKFLRLYPEHVEKVMDILEQTYFDLGVYDKVEALYAGILERFPDKREVRLRLARMKVKEGGFTDALSLLNEVLVANPKELVFLMERIKLLMVQKDWKAAQVSFDKLYEQLTVMPEICPECGCSLGPVSWFCPECGCPVCEP